MGGTSLEDMLKLFGLTEKETEVYLYLAKQGVKKTSQIAKALKTNKGLVYRILKRLEQKELVEITLESPSRFIVVPFEKLIDTYIELRRDEAAFIENKKQQLLSDWKKIGHPEPEFPVEKFSVIEDEKKVFHKICEMVYKTKKEFVSIATVQGLLRAEKYGVLDCMLNHPLRSEIKIRYITRLNDENVTSLKFLLKKFDSLFSLKGKHSHFQDNIFPRLAIRDKEEILLFITDQQQNNSGYVDTALCTNCKLILQSFYEVFQDTWNKSSDIENVIQEIENGEPPAIMELIKDPYKAKEEYYDTLDKAKNDIFIVTSSKGLHEIEKNKDFFNKFMEHGVSIKIMAPITNNNLKTTHRLLQCCEIRHIPLGYREITIVDNHQLFQFNNPSITNVEEIENFQNVFFTNDMEYIKETKRVLFDIWKFTHTPLSRGVRSLQCLSFNSNGAMDDHTILTKTGLMQKRKYRKHLTENQIIGIINEDKKLPKKDKYQWSDTVRYFGSVGCAAIYPPKGTAMPNIMIAVYHFDEFSSFGDEDFLIVHLELQRADGLQFHPVALVLDSKASLEFRKKLFSGTPAEHNIMIFNKNEIKVRIKGKTLFAGWSKPIPLKINDCVLPPACILYEGHGKVRSGGFNNVHASGRRQKVWYNSLDSFVTLFLPTSKYSGASTEGFLERETEFISKPPVD